jgi:hypothetical protein
MQHKIFKNECQLIPKCDVKFPNCGGCDKYSDNCTTCQEYFKPSTNDSNKCIIDCPKKYKNCSDCNMTKCNKCQVGYYQETTDCIPIPECDEKFPYCNECDQYSKNCKTCQTG